MEKRYGRRRLLITIPSRDDDVIGFAGYENGGTAIDDALRWWMSCQLRGCCSCFVRESSVNLREGDLSTPTSLARSFLFALVLLLVGSDARTSLNQIEKLLPSPAAASLTSIITQNPQANVYVRQQNICVALRSSPFSFFLAISHGRKSRSSAVGVSEATLTFYYEK